jgi:hypothetical protein
MSVTTLKPVMRSELPSQPVATTFSSLAERLLEGPFRTLVSLHVRASTLAATTEDGDLARLEKLVELRQLARMATAQMNDFSLELESLIDHLAAANGKTQ